jgi:coatomer protein complex subunit gamma
MKQITGFMSEISDEFKVIVVDAIRSLCLKFPTKQVVMLSFLSGVLRDEGGYEFKRAVVEAIFDLVKFIPESKEAGKSFKNPSSLTILHIYVSLKLILSFFFFLLSFGSFV